MQNKKWLELAHEKKGHIYPPAIYWFSAQYVCREVGITDGIIATWHKNHEFSYLVTPGSFLCAGKIILERLEKDQRFLARIVEVNNKKIPTMLAAAKLLSGDLRNMDGKELYNRWNNWLQEFLSLMTYSAMGTVMEMEEPLLTNKLEKLIAKKAGKDNPNLGKYFQILTTATERTAAGQEEIDLLKLRFKQLTSNLQDGEISEHTKKYSWIAFGYDGPGWNENDVKQRTEQLSHETDEIEELINEKENAEKKILSQQKKVELTLQLTKQERYLFHVLRILGFWKFERKFRNQQAHEMMEDFIRETARRNCLSIAQAKMIGLNEMEDVLIHNKIESALLNERIKESVVLIKGMNYKILEGEKAKVVLEKIHKSLVVDLNIRELHGSSAYPGYVKGRVKQIDLPEEMKKLNSGDILISTSTSPQILPAMKRAAAIITDTGGITCHAAIIAREIKIPTVIGTKIATKLLKDGDIVEVDANKGVVKILKK